MFLVKLEGCLNRMNKGLISFLFIGLILLCEQVSFADLTDSLEDLDLKSGEKESQSSTPNQNRNMQQKVIEPSAVEPLKPNDARVEPADKITSKPEEKRKRSQTKPSQDGEQKLPVVFEGDQLSGIKRLGTIELHQNVKVNQGDFNMEAENAKVFFDTEADEVRKVIAKGSVKISKIDPQTGELIRAYSQIAEFDAINQVVELIDKAKLIRGQDVIRGQVILYDLKTGQLKASKVKGVVKPQESE